MKKILVLIFILASFAMLAQAQAEYESKFMRFYVPDCTGSPFPTPVDTYITMTAQGQWFIKIHANFSYNAVEFSYFQKYAVPKGNNIYLKLDTDSIISLPCSLDKSIKDGFATTNNGVYQNYAEYSYFPIDETTINKLKKHNIIKVRGQFKFEIMDGSLQFTPDSDMPKTKDAFVQAKQIALEKYKAAKNKSKAQEMLKQDPLHDF